MSGSVRIALLVSWAVAAVIGAGCGRFVAQHLAKRLDRPYRDFAKIIDCADDAREMAPVAIPVAAEDLPTRPASCRPTKRYWNKTNRKRFY